MTRPRMLTVAVFNATGGSNNTAYGKFATWYDDLDADVAIVSEVFRYRRVLKKLGHLRTGKVTHGAQDVGVITKWWPRHWRLLQVTRFVPRPRSKKPLLWHDRWAVRVGAGRWPNRVVAVSSHAPAVIQNKATGRLLNNAGAAEWREHGLPATEDLLRRDMRHNRVLFHGGDLNQRPSDADDNPAQMYARLGMKWIHDDVMWLAWNPKRLHLIGHEVLPTPPGSDGHKTLHATFTIKETR